MAKNTGFQQAIYAAKFTHNGNIPLDKEGNFCSISGNKQAILLLEGHENPDPSKYEVVGSFKEGDTIDQYPSMIYNTDACPLPLPDIPLPEYQKEPLKFKYFKADPLYDISSDDRPYIIDRFAQDDWDKDISEIPQTGGLTKGTYPTRRIGEYEWMIDNFRLRYTPNGYLRQYALTQASLDKSDIDSSVVDFIQTNGTPFYAGIDVDKYFPLVKCFDIPDNFNKDSTENLFSSRYITDYKVENGRLVHDPNYISWFLPPKYGSTWTRYLLSKNGPTSILQSYMVWGSDGNYTIQDGQTETASGDINVFSGKIYGYQTGVLIVVSSDGIKLEDLPQIKIEAISNDAPKNPTPWNEPIWNHYQSGWDIPTKEDIMQLFGMVGDNLSVDNLIENLFVSSNDTELSWVDNWTLASQSKDTIGSRFLPCGQRDSSKDSPIMGFGERLAFGTKREDGIEDAATPPVIFNMQGSTNSGGNLIYDYDGEKEGNIKFWQRNQRFCRRLTDQELGYRLWVDEANDKIQVTLLTESQPINTIELGKGLLRGLAVRWMNNEKTKVLASLSKLREEIEKTKDGGEYGWLGFDK